MGITDESKQIVINALCLDIKQMTFVEKQENHVDKSLSEWQLKANILFLSPSPSHRRNIKDTSVVWSRLCCKFICKMTSSVSRSMHAKAYFRKISIPKGSEAFNKIFVGIVKTVWVLSPQNTHPYIWKSHGRKTSAEICGLDDVIPPDDLGRFDIMDNTSYFFCVFWHMQLYMSWYIRSFFGFTFLNILYFFKYYCTNIFHRRSLYTFYWIKNRNPWQFSSFYACIFVKSFRSCIQGAEWRRFAPVSWYRPSLVRFCVIDTNPLSEQMLGYCFFFNEIKPQIQLFSSVKIYFKWRLRNDFIVLIMMDCHFQYVNTSIGDRHSKLCCVINLHTASYNV